MAKKPNRALAIAKSLPPNKKASIKNLLSPKDTQDVVEAIRYVASLPQHKQPTPHQLWQALEDHYKLGKTYTTWKVFFQDNGWKYDQGR